jgi:hypothetical protein
MLMLAVAIRLSVLGQHGRPHLDVAGADADFHVVAGQSRRLLTHAVPEHCRVRVVAGGNILSTDQLSPPDCTPVLPLHTEPNDTPKLLRAKLPKPAASSCGAVPGWIGQHELGPGRGEPCVSLPSNATVPLDRAKSNDGADTSPAPPSGRRR